MQNAVQPNIDRACLLEDEYQAEADQPDSDFEDSESPQKIFLAINDKTRQAAPQGKSSHECRQDGADGKNGISQYYRQHPHPDYFMDQRAET